MKSTMHTFKNLGKVRKVPITSVNCLFCINKIYHVSNYEISIEERNVKVKNMLKLMSFLFVNNRFCYRNLNNYFILMSPINSLLIPFRKVSTFSHIVNVLSLLTYSHSKSCSNK